MNQKIAPVSADKRLATLDILRGFALFGILMVNMIWYSNPIASLISDNSLWTDTQSVVTRFMIGFLFEGKFYVLFSMLFGYGFWLFLNKKNNDGKPVTGLFAMRLFVLLLIGVAHVVLLWAGDILVFYALLGFVLMLFRNVKKDRTLLIWAAVFISWPVLLMGFLALLFQIPEVQAVMDQAMVEQDAYFISLIDKALSVFQQGSFSEMIRMRLLEYSLSLSGFFFFHVNILAMFLIGVYAARKKYMARTSELLPFFKKLCFYGFMIGIPANLFTAIALLYHDIYSPSAISFYYMLVSSFGSPALTIAYVSGIVILIEKGVLSKLFNWLSFVGRMALTNYLLHSIIASFLFFSYGLGLFGKVNPLQSVLLVFIVYGLQIPFSIFWLKKFRFGPFEWLWRSLTYRRIQPFRKKPGSN